MQEFMICNITREGTRWLFCFGLFFWFTAFVSFFDAEINAFFSGVRALWSMMMFQQELFKPNVKCAFSIYILFIENLFYKSRPFFGRRWNPKIITRLDGLSELSYTILMWTKNCTNTKLTRILNCEQDLQSSKQAQPIKLWSSLSFRLSLNGSRLSLKSVVRSVLFRMRIFQS